MPHPIQFDANHTLYFSPERADNDGKGWYFIRESPERVKSQYFESQSEANHAFFNKKLRFPSIRKKAKSK